MLRNRLLWTAVILLAAAGALTGHIDKASGEQAENALKNALVTFAVARTLNGVISAAQGTEVALEPGGVGVVLSVGEILDPVNDLIERFSTRSTAAQYAGPALRILLFLLFVRFAVPVLIVGTTVISDAFLAPEQEAATAILRDTTEDIERINEEARPVPPEEQSFMDRLGEMIDESLESMRIGDRMKELKESASNAAEHIVSLIAIFVLQTILLPLLFLWIFIAVLKGIAGRSAQLFQAAAGRSGQSR